MWTHERSISTPANGDRSIFATASDTLSSVNNLAALYRAQGRYGEAEPLYKEALEKRREVLGESYPNTLSSVNNLAFLYQAQGRYGEAEPLYKEALEKSREVLGESHPNTLLFHLNYIALLMNLQKERDALRLLKKMEAHLFAYTTTQLDTLSKERTRRLFQLSKSTFQDVAFSLAHQKPSSQATRYAAQVLLRWKQIQAEEEAYVAQLVRTTRDPRILAVGEKIIELRARLSIAR